MKNIIYLLIIILYLSYQAYSYSGYSVNRFNTECRDTCITTYEDKGCTE